MSAPRFDHVVSRRHAFFGAIRWHHRVGLIDCHLIGHLFIVRVRRHAYFLFKHQQTPHLFLQHEVTVLIRGLSQDTLLNQLVETDGIIFLRDVYSLSIFLEGILHSLCTLPQFQSVYLTTANYELLLCLSIGTICVFM